MEELLSKIPWVSAWLAGNGLLGWVGSILSIVLSFALAWLGVRVVRRLTSRISKRYKERRPDVATARRADTAVSLINSAAKALLIFIAVGITLGELGLAKVMNAMLVAAGIGSVAVGIGAQSLIGDVIAGACMLLEEQLGVGDYVKLNGITGTVERITLRTVSLRCYQGEVCTLPCSKIDTVINYSQGGFLALVDISISRDEDVERAFETLLSVLEEIRGELGAERIAPPQRVGVVSAGAQEGITLRAAMRADVGEQWSIQYEARRRARLRLVSAGVELASVRVTAEGKA